MKRIIMCGLALATLAMAGPAFAKGEDVAVILMEAPMTPDVMSQMKQANTNHSHIMMMIKLDHATMEKMHAQLNGNNLHLMCQADSASPDTLACYQGGSVGG